MNQVMQVQINGKPSTLDREVTIEELLGILGYEREGVAVARNQEFVPRGRHGVDIVQAGDEIEIVSPRQGG